MYKSSEKHFVLNMMLSQLTSIAASLHGRMLNISYLACGWQGDGIVWCVFAKEETEASMLRLA